MARVCVCVAGEEEVGGEGTVEVKVPEVEASHPEVVAIVEEAMKKAELQTVTLPPDDYLAVLQQALEDLQKRKTLQNPNGAM